MSNFGKDNVECRTDNQAILENLDSYRFNTPLNEIENSDLIILLGTNPKIETPIINHKIFKAYNNNSRIFNIGENISLNYQTEYLGDKLSNLNNEKLIKALKKSSNPLIIIGSDFLSIPIDLTGYVLDLDLELDPQVVNYVSTINIPSDDEMTISFGESIAIGVLIDSISFSSLSGYVDPVLVDIDTVEQEISLPDELDKLEFSRIEMDFSFRSNIQLPVYLDLYLASFNDETGESVVKRVQRVNIIEQPIFSIDSAQHLINIQPNRIVASGTAEVGSLSDYGYVTMEDTISGKLIMSAPLAFEINGDSRICLLYTSDAADE